MPSTFRSAGHSRLRALCEGIGFDPSVARSVFDALIEPWGDREVGSTPSWPSDITDDHTPFELSVGLEAGQADPRFLVESLGDEPTLASSWAAGLATNERLQARYGVALDRLTLVEELFQPHDSEARFAMWHAAWLRADAVPLFKVYLNPQARGPAAAPALVEEALARLGFSRAWKFLEERLSKRPGLDRLIYLSLDLEPSDDARVKIYLAHADAVAAEIELLLADSPQHVPGDAERFCRALADGAGPYRSRPLQTCWAFTTADDARPRNVTFYFPIRCYVANDQLALERISRFMGGAEGEAYRRAVAAVAPRPLEAGVGLQTYASFRRQGARLRFTAYLAAELYSAHAAGSRVALPGHARAGDLGAATP